MRCDECRFWEAAKADDWSEVSTLLGTCLRTDHLDDARGWDDEGRDTLKPEYADRTAFSYDASGYASGLRTKAEHFCAMFQPKEA